MKKMSKIIYSIFEIEKKASLINADRELKKDWLSKSMELVSSKTVLKDIKLGEQEIKKAEKSSEELEKLIFFQEAIGYFCMGNLRANGKDRKAAKSLEESIETYMSLLLKYFLELYKNLAMYELNYDILEEIAYALRERNNRVDVREILSEYEKNKVIYDFYREIIELREDSTENLRKKYKEYIEENNSDFAKNVKVKLSEEFRNKKDFFSKLVNDEILLKKANRIEIQKNLKFIKYFNTSLYLKFKNIVYKYFSYKSIKQYFENEYTYIDYEGLERTFKVYSKTLEITESNQLITEEEIKLKKVILKYSDAYTFYNFNLFFDFSQKEFSVEKLIIVEKFIRNIVNYDKNIISNLSLLRNLENLLEVQKKIEQIIRQVEICDLSFKNELLKRLYYLHHKNKDNLSVGDNYKLIIRDLEKNINYHFIKKEEIELGRSRSNEIRLNNKYVSRKHLKFVMNDGNIVNYEKAKMRNISYINNNSKETIGTKNLFFDDVREINIGNIFTFRVDTKENYTLLDPFLIKSNRALLTDEEIEGFVANKYILMKDVNKIYLDVQKENIYIKEAKINKKDIKLELNKWPIVKIGNDIETTIQIGENILNENFKIYLEVNK